MSRMDTEIRSNIFHHTVDLPYTCGCDMVGTVVGVNGGSDKVKVGDRVCSVGLRLGGNARYVLVRADRLFHVPPNLESLSVACLLRVYVTAYQCLHRSGKFAVEQGDRVLVTGGTGCVGQAAIQLAKAAGALAVYATGGKPELLPVMGGMGALQLGREPAEWLPKVEGRMDVVIDTVGADWYEPAHKALNEEGKLVVVGTVSMLGWGPLSGLIKREICGQPPQARINVLKASYLMSRTSFYDFFKELDENPQHYVEDLKHLFSLLQDGLIKPRVIKRIPLHEVAIAHLEIQRGGVNGFIVCLPQLPSPKNTLMSMKHFRSPLLVEEDKSMSKDYGTSTYQETDNCRDTATELTGMTGASSKSNSSSSILGLVAKRFKNLKRADENKSMAQISFGDTSFWSIDAEITKLPKRSGKTRSSPQIATGPLKGSLRSKPLAEVKEFGKERHQQQTVTTAKSKGAAGTKVEEEAREEQRKESWQDEHQSMSSAAGDKDIGGKETCDEVREDVPEDSEWKDIAGVDSVIELENEMIPERMISTQRSRNWSISLSSSRNRNGEKHERRKDDAVLVQDLENGTSWEKTSDKLSSTVASSKRVASANRAGGSPRAVSLSKRNTRRGKGFRNIRSEDQRKQGTGELKAQNHDHLNFSHNSKGKEKGHKIQRGLKNRRSKNKEEDKPKQKELLFEFDQKIPGSSE